MAIDDKISERFAAWEIRARGHAIFSEPVALEPPFVPFPGYRFARTNRDDGRRQTSLSAFFGRPFRQPEPEEPPEPDPVWTHAEDLSVISVTPSRSEPRTADLLRLCRHATAFEILGTEHEVVAQWVVPKSQEARWKRAVASTCEGSVAAEGSQELPTAVVVDLGLRAPAMFGLATGTADIAAVLDGLGKDELGLFQVLFEPVENDWASEMERSLSLENGKVLDADALKHLERKSRGRMFAAIVRIAADAETFERAWEIIADIAAVLSGFDDANGFVPLRNDGYPHAEHLADVELRLSRRPGMILGFEEMCALISPPFKSRCRKLRQSVGNLAPVFSETRSVLLGTNRYAGESAEVWLPPEKRVRHMHLVGASGTGKSTLLFNMLRKDIENGEGIALLDPHGDLVERVLGFIPRDRLDDVVLVDPSDDDHVVGFNILAAHSDFERNLLASDLVSTFRRLSTSWGEQMNSVLRNAVLAFLESSRGGTLADLRRFLLDGAFRKKFLATVTDPDVIFYWERAFPQLTGNKSIGPVMTRLDEFLSRKPIRNMVSQHENKINFADILDNSRILLVKLPQGQIGRENANLLGSIFMSKIQQMAMGRQRMKESERRDFWVYLDEFHNFITPSMAEILTGARKYRVGLILAHQELHQLEADREVASAVLANCCTRIAFRVSDRDAKELAQGFAHFEAADLQNLRVGEAIARIERSDADFNLSVSEPAPADESETEKVRTEARRISNERYARKRAEVEAELLEKVRRELSESPSKPEKHPLPPDKSPDTGSEKESPPSTPPEPTPPPPIAETPSVSNPQSVPPVQGTVGQGRGGEDHQLIVANLASEAARLGFRAIKECVVPDGRIDLVIEKAHLRIAIEVAVNSNTAHEIENLQKCLEPDPSFVVSVSPHENVRDNIARAAARKFDSETLAKIRFEPPENVLEWMREISETIPADIAPEAPKTKTIAGRKVRIRQVEMSPEERRKKEAAEIEVIADLLRKRSPKT